MAKNYCLVEATVLVYATLLSYGAHSTSYRVTICYNLMANGVVGIYNFNLPLFVYLFFIKP